MSPPTYARHRRVAVITPTNPPINALGLVLRRHIVDSLAQAEPDPEIQAVLLVGSERAFAGADVREFGKPPPLLESATASRPVANP